MNPLRIGITISILVTAIHDAAAQEPIVLKHDGWVAAIAFAPDGKTLASGGSDKVVRLWEIGTWKSKDVLKGHTDYVSAIAFAQGTNLLVSGSFDRTVRLWDIDKHEGKQLMKSKYPVTAVGIQLGFPNSVFVFGGLDGRVANQPQPESRLFQHKSWVNCFAVHESAFASASSDGTVALVHGWRSLDKPVFLEGGAGEVRSVSFSPDGKFLAAGNRFGTVRVWDVASRKEVKTLTGHMGEVWSVAFSPDGKTLAAVDTEWKKPSKIKLYDTTTWKERDALPCPGEILCIAYSPNGDWLAAGCWDKTVRVFSLKR